jgi:hypothetical protein
MLYATAAGWIEVITSVMFSGKIQVRRRAACLS